MDVGKRLTVRIKKVDRKGISARKRYRKAALKDCLFCKKHQSRITQHIHAF